MASIAHDRKNNTRRILFVDGDRKRKTIRLGKMSAKDATTVRNHVEALLAAKLAGSSVARTSALWLADLGDVLHDRVARAGLCEPRTAPGTRTLGGLLDSYFDVLDVKDSTRGRYEQTERLLVDYFGRELPLAKITIREADGWRSALVERGLAQATVSKNVGIARQMFRKAHQWSLIASNPFEGVKAGSQHNRERLHYVPRADVERLLDAAPSIDWKAIIALARWGGLRTPSETLSVRWVDVDWDRGRLRVRSPKTEGHEGKGARIIPLFPELRAVLVEAFEAAPDDSVYIVNGYRDATAANLRTQLGRIIERAGLQAWPRLFNALRASRATELAADYPIAVCTSWLGHTAAVAQAHYHMVRESDFAHAAGESTEAPGAQSGAQAAQNAAQHTPANTRDVRKASPQNASGEAFMRGIAEPCNYPHNHQLSATGLEPVTSAM